MIPKSFINEYLPKATGIRFCNIPLEELSRDELIVCVAMALEREREGREESARQRKFLLSLRYG